MRFATRTVHVGNEPDTLTGAVTPAIYTSSTYAQAGIGKTKGYEYSRSGNPTRERLEKSIANLENADHGLAFSSGLAAETTVAGLLGKGDHVIMCNDVYGGTHRLFDRVFSNYGVSFTISDARREAELEKAVLKDRTKMIWMESPTNPLMTILDIKKVANFASDHDLTLVVDNTFASPCLQNPLTMGATIVVHSTTKYIGGHSDLIGGALATSDDQLYERLKFLQNATGVVPSPFDCYLALRGIRTLHLRMERHSENALAVAKALQRNSMVETVNYPFLRSSPDYSLAKKQMRAGGGMLSFRIKHGFRATAKFLKSLKIFVLAESLGGVESLADHPARMTHASLPKRIRESFGIGDDLVRLSVGVEDKRDLIEDLASALERAST
jgi:cystathionine beta-lyase/cystathionine gamma-synthase